MECKVGDIVYLKSDVDVKILMTVNSSAGGEFFKCVWFDNKDLKEGIFHKNALKVVPKE